LQRRTEAAGNGEEQQRHAPENSTPSALTAKSVSRSSRQRPASEKSSQTQLAPSWRSFEEC